MNKNARYIWVSSDSKKIYLNNNYHFALDLFSEGLMKNIRLIVSYNKDNRYEICVYEREGLKELNNTDLTIENNQLKNFFEYLKKNNLYCAEYDIELIDGTQLKTYYGNDLIIITENVDYINQIIITLPKKLTKLILNKNNKHSKIIKYKNTSVLCARTVLDIEDFLDCNEDFFY